MANQKQEVLRAVRTFFVTLVAVYVARGSYKLNLDELKGYPDQVDEAFWKELKVEQAARVCDEHFYKLVQVSTVLYGPLIYKFDFTASLMFGIVNTSMITSVHNNEIY